MDTNRLEAFSDGVFAIAITLLILEIKVPPPGTALGVGLLQLWPSYLAYVVSFLVIGAIWINHHAMFKHIVRVDGLLLLLNVLHLMLISLIDHKAFLSKNLFNLANYHYRQHFFQHQQKLNFNQLYHLLSQTPDYKALPTKVSKQIIRRLDSAWTSYFQAGKTWHIHPEKFGGKPRIPGYKHKTKGRNILPYPDEAISKKALKKGICHLSMSEIKIATSQKQIQEARIVPKSSCYVLEILYEKNEETTNHQQIAGIDLGVNNLMAVTTNQTGVRPLLIKGRPLKAINTFYNKQRSDVQSQLKIKQNQNHSQRLKNITHKRNCRV